MAEDCSPLARGWLTKGLHDLQNAQIISAAPDGPLDTAIYHCQQAAEKALKGWLAWRGIKVAKTHDLIRLIQEAAEQKSEFAQFEEAAALLAPYVSAFRYPGLVEDSMPGRDELNQALEHAKAIYDFVADLVPREARPESGSATNPECEVD